MLANKAGAYLTEAPSGALLYGRVLHNVKLFSHYWFSEKIS
jgi:hypothetical protein